MNTILMMGKDYRSADRISSLVSLLPREKIKAEENGLRVQGVRSDLPVKLEPQDSLQEQPEVKPRLNIKYELQEETSDPSAVKQEIQDIKQERQDVKPGVVPSNVPGTYLIRVKTNEPKEDSSTLKAESQEVKHEIKGGKNETRHITSDRNIYWKQPQRAKWEPVITEQDASASLVIKSTSSLSDEETSEIKTLISKKENVSTTIKEERIESLQIENELVTIGRVNPASMDSGRPRRACKHIDYSVFGDNGRGENEAVSEAEVPGDSPVVWVNVKDEMGDEIEQATNLDYENEEENVDDPDWKIDEINNGMGLVRNINMVISKSIKTEGGSGVSNPSTVLRGRRKMRKMKPEELLKELVDVHGLSAEQAELVVGLRSRMDFSDPTTLSYWDGLKCHICLVCAYTTHVPAHMVKHLRHHTGDKPYICAECDYRCVESSSMATHMRTHTGEKPHACPHCDYKTNGSSILKTHIMIHTGKKPLSCPHCDFKCREHGGLKRHIRTHTGEKPFACPHCDYRGPSSTCLKSHIKIHTKEKPYLCSYCEYATACSSSLTIHVRRHTGEKPYSCNLCSYKFVTSGTLKVHMRTHTGEKPFLCKTCGYRCATHGRFKSHLRIHSGDKKHECPFCDYKSVRADNLKMHIRTHTGEKPHQCPHCDYRSSEKVRMVQHIRVHTGEKPFVCSVCGFKTADRNGLRSHSRIHSDEKPFCCSYCDFKTARRGILKTHIMRHTGDKPYACPYCPYKCTKSCSLKGHVANNHIGNKKKAL